MNAFEEEWWTMLGLPVAALVGVAIGRWLGPEGRRAFCESDAGSRVIGLVMVVGAALLYRTLAYLPVSKALQSGRRTLFLNVGVVAMTAIIAQIGLLFLVLGRRKERWFPADQSQGLTREQHLLAVTIVAVGLVAMFCFMWYFGISPGQSTVR